MSVNSPCSDWFVKVNKWIQSIRLLEAWIWYGWFNTPRNEKRKPAPGTNCGGSRTELIRLDCRIVPRFPMAANRPSSHATWCRLSKARDARKVQMVASGEVAMIP